MRVLEGKSDQAKSAVEDVGEKGKGAVTGFIDAVRDAASKVGHAFTRD